ncbi:Signal transduction histidine kinase [Desulfurella multipotens]|uniref:histidine kinase n=1 Tax=Desulfurella multipotens TaxID=79269 RepID=A0A1G6JJQ0_9BACT|nr:HAMP domain-containing sensor histidine kinase [Desulfurella multipotens]SDC18933.1 Signal transduction histidine kinase [Desulfurella multipotens]
MFLKKSNFFSKISVKILLWYSAIFISNAIFLFLLAYFIVSATLRDKETTSISLEMEKILLDIQKYGLSNIDKHISHKEKEDFVIEILFKNKPLYVSENFKKLELGNKIIENIKSKKKFFTINLDDKTFKFQIYQATSYTIVVGKNVASTEELLEKFREIFFGMILFTMLLGIIGGLIALRKILLPIKSITQTAQYIINTGKLNERIKVENTQDELYDLSVIINKMLDKIEVLVKSLKETIDNVAHDLRTPLTRIKITSELALSEQSKLNPKDALLSCLDESDKILTLLNAIVDISQIETGSLKLNIERIQLKKLIDDVIDLYDYVIEEHNINLSVKCNENIYIYGDFNRLRQALSNLMDNAIKYNKPNGKISIKALEINDKICLFIRDTGIGIDAKDLPYIFERLYRADKSRSKQGLGLGLSLVKAIIKAHEAKIKVKSKLTCGTIFCIIFHH